MNETINAAAAADTINAAAAADTPKLEVGSWKLEYLPR
jgi:hypothetical protein